MKKLILVTLVLIIALGAWGSVIITYATTPHTIPVPTPAPIPTQPSQSKELPVTPVDSAKGNIVYHGSSSLPEVALTFDDGPSLYYTPQVLTILHQYGVHATFFTIGENVRLYPELVQQEYYAGHVIGNHSWDHPYLTQRSAASVYSELSRTGDMIQQTIGIRPTLFRPPYGAINAQVEFQASRLGLISVVWNVDTRDWDQPRSTESVIINNVLKGVSNGSIVLMHDAGGNRSRTIATLPKIIVALRQRGYQLVTISQLLSDMQTGGTGYMHVLTKDVA
ncbi:MAG: polysaccharide deacetylase family protein [Ktedonobacteraceae bacterium]|nr:polysaccharide deacetylase family protein [Ktedonobacteraceae bacterium]